MRLCPPCIADPSAFWTLHPPDLMQLRIFTRIINFKTPNSKADGHCRFQSSNSFVSRKHRGLGVFAELNFLLYGMKGGLGCRIYWLLCSIYLQKKSFYNTVLHTSKIGTKHRRLGFRPRAPHVSPTFQVNGGAGGGFHTVLYVFSRRSRANVSALSMSNTFRSSTVGYGSSIPLFDGGSFGNCRPTIEATSTDARLLSCRSISSTSLLYSLKHLPFCFFALSTSLRLT